MDLLSEITEDSVLLSPRVICNASVQWSLFSVKSNYPHKTEPRASRLSRKVHASFSRGEISALLGTRPHFPCRKSLRFVGRPTRTVSEEWQNAAHSRKKKKREKKKKFPCLRNMLENALMHLMPYKPSPYSLQCGLHPASVKIELETKKQAVFKHFSLSAKKKRCSEIKYRLALSIYFVKTKVVPEITVCSL